MYPSKDHDSDSDQSKNIKERKRNKSQNGNGGDGKFVRTFFFLIIDFGCLPLLTHQLGGHQMSGRNDS